MKTFRLAGVSAVLMSALLLAGCGGQQGGDNKVASLGGDKDKASQGQDADVPKDPKEKMLKFAKCMRDNGVEIPDPKGDGEAMSLPAFRAGDDAQMETFNKANKACKKFSPASDFNPDDPKVKEEQLKFAQCMRSKGIDMPDPGAGGSTMRIPTGDADGKKMEEAMKACGKGGFVATAPGGGE